MTARATVWAWSQRGISSDGKLFLLHLADCHDEKDNLFRYRPEKALVETGLDFDRQAEILLEARRFGLIMEWRTANDFVEVEPNFDARMNGLGTSYSGSSADG